MALTIQDQPTASTFYSVGNPIDILVSSSNAAATNFKVNLQVYSPASSTLLATLKYDTIPSTTQIYADVHRILKTKFGEDSIVNLRTSATGIKNETTKHFTANIVLQEYFGSVPALTGSTSTSNTFSIFNGSLKYKGWQAGDVDKYRIDSTIGTNTLSQRFLTGFDNVADVTESVIFSSPATYFKGSYNVRKITSAQLAQFSWLWQGTGGTSAVITLAAFKTDLSSYIQTSKSLTSVHSLMSMNFGTDVLIAGGWAALDSTYTYLSVKLKQTDGTEKTGLYFFEIDWTPCSRYESFEIHWLNRYGGWDSWVFDKRSRHVTDIKRKEYNKLTLPISGSSIVHNIYDIKGINHVVSTVERYELNSDNLQAWQLAGLEDLATSPLVYWNSSDGFINIVPKDPESHEHKTNIVDKLFNFSFSFEIDNQDIRQ